MPSHGRDAKDATVTAIRQYDAPRTEDVCFQRVMQFTLCAENR